MRRIGVFSLRNIKELVRDPLMLIFNLAFPIVLLLLLSAIQANVPVELFAIEKLAPGIAVFGLSFIALFAGSLIAKDRTTSFLMRLFTTPMKSSDFLLGYTLPVLPAAVAQSVVCYLLAFALGMKPTWNVLLSLVVLLPASLLFIAIGLLLGTVFNDKAVGGVASIIINVSAWLSGIWFDLKLVGGVFNTIGYLLPFAHAVDAAKAAVAGDYSEIFPHLIWVIAYAAVTMTAAVLLFSSKMKKDK